MNRMNDWHIKNIVSELCPSSVDKFLSSFFCRLNQNRFDHGLRYEQLMSDSHNSSSNTQRSSQRFLSVVTNRKTKMATTSSSKIRRDQHEQQQQQQDQSFGNDNNNNHNVARSLDDFLQDALAQSHDHRRDLVVSLSSAETDTYSTIDTGRTATNNSKFNKIKFHQWRYWMIFISLGVANSSDASEILCLSYILSYEPFQNDMLYHTAWRASLLAATVFLGMLVGGLTVGTLGDSLGRRPMLLAGLCTNCFSGLLSAVAPDVVSLSLCRLVAGFGIGASVPPLFTLCSELAAPAHRGFWVTVAASFWMVGSIYVALTGWYCLGGSGSTTNDDTDDNDEQGNVYWRVFAATCALPSALGCVLVYALVPESPRFLALAGKHCEAVIAAQYVADCLLYTGPPLTVSEVLEHYPLTANDSGDDYDDDDDQGDHMRLRPRRRIPQSLSMQPTGGSYEVSSSSSSLNRYRNKSIGSMILLAWVDFLASTRKLYTVQLRQTTWPLQMVWFSLSFGSYGLLTWINRLFFEVHLQNVYQNALLFALSNLPGNILSALLMDRTGRTTLLIGSVVAAALSLVVFAYVAYTNKQYDDSNDDHQQHPQLSTAWIVGSACAFQCFTISAWNAIDVMTSELFPTAVRSTGLGVCAASGRIGALLAQFVNGALVEDPVRLLLVAATTLMLGALTPALLPVASDRTGQPVADRIDGVVVVAAAMANSENESHGHDALDDGMIPLHAMSSSSSPYNTNANTNANASPDKLGTYYGVSANAPR
jgi:MFS family permease